MWKLQMLVVVAVSSVVLAACTHRAQARPGPRAFHALETTNAGEFQPDHLAPGELQTGDFPSVQLNEDSEGQNSEDELDVICTEMGTSCEEKRLLLAHLDYKDDGPNNPITDPPH